MAINRAGSGRHEDMLFTKKNWCYCKSSSTG